MVEEVLAQQDQITTLDQILDLMLDLETIQVQDQAHVLVHVLARNLELDLAHALAPNLERVQIQNRDLDPTLDLEPHLTQGQVLDLQQDLAEAEEIILLLEAALPDQVQDLWEECLLDLEGEDSNKTYKYHFTSPFY